MMLMMMMTTIMIMKNTRLAKYLEIDLLGLCPDEVLLLGGQNAQGELLARAALPIHHVCALVHVDGALREGCGLREEEDGAGSQSLWGQRKAAGSVPASHGPF